MIWKEIRASYSRSLVPLGGNLLPASPELHIIRDEWYAAGLSTKDPDRFQGYHEEYILVVVDEACGVSETIFEAIEGVLTSQGARLLLLGNPTMVGGTFHRAFTTPGWNTINISAFDTPNFTEFGIVQEDIANGTWQEKVTGDLPMPKLVTPQWVADRYTGWGVDSLAYQARVLGQFPSAGDDTLIPLSWIETAMVRWEDEPEGTPVEIGVDVARFGDDRTVIVTRKGNKVLEIEEHHKLDTMEVVGRVNQKQATHNAEQIKVDVIGLGAGVFDRAKELKLPVSGVNVAERAVEHDRFVNKRSELWWLLRDLLNPDLQINPDPISLPPDDELLAELSSVKYKIDSRGRVQVESKDDMKKRLGRSPDKADAVILAFAREGSPPDDPLAWEVMRNLQVY